jgi:hypothetical protein
VARSDACFAGRLAVVVALAATSTGCGGSTDPGFDVPDRAAGERAPLTSACDDVDLTRCQLPWPSSRFLVIDASSPTGVRQQLDSAAEGDDASSAMLADGFSRLSPLLVGAETVLSDVAEDALRAWVVEPNHPSYGEEVELRVELQTDDNLGESFVVAYPRRPMPENVAVVAVALRGGGLEPSAATSTALALTEPASQEQAELRAYHAPTRAFLSSVGVDASNVARVWDFVTRSQAGVVEPLLEVRERLLTAVDQGIALTIDDVVIAPSETITLIAEGTVDIPWLVTDALPDPGQKAMHEARFRVVIPEGTGDYPVILFGHGLGGSFDDPAFDEALALEGLGKLGVDFHGWTIDSFLDTLGGFIRPYEGSARAAGLMMQAVGELSAMQRALAADLGDLLAADTIAGMPNPAAGRRPDMNTPMYGGGSLGGSVGYLYANMEPTIPYAALNVGGGGWSHFLRSSVFFSPLAALMRISLGSPLDVTLVVSQTQTNLDYMDGAAWADHRDEPPVFLLQESIDDLVLPNIGTELMAVSSGAQLVGEALVSFGGLESTSMAVEQTAITQFRVSGDDAGIHGFAITDTVAGEAARAQIRHFFATALAGSAEVIVPPQCPASGCDFSD